MIIKFLIADFVLCGLLLVFLYFRYRNEKDKEVTDKEYEEFKEWINNKYNK